MHTVSQRRVALRRFIWKSNMISIFFSHTFDTPAVYYTLLSMFYFYMSAQYISTCPSQYCYISTKEHIIWLHTTRTVIRKYNTVTTLLFLLRLHKKVNKTRSLYLLFSNNKANEYNDSVTFHNEICIKHNNQVPTHSLKQHFTETRIEYNFLTNWALKKARLAVRLFLWKKWYTLY